MAKAGQDNTSRLCWPEQKGAEDNTTDLCDCVEHRETEVRSPTLLRGDATDHLGACVAWQRRATV
jgi:hypothetical protein